MDDYLSKPVTREHLENTLRRWLDTPRLRRTPVAAAPASAPSPAPSLDIMGDFSDMPELTATAEAFQTSPVSGTSSAATTAAAKPAAPPPTNMSPASTQPTGPALDSEIIEDLWSAMGTQFKELVDVFLQDAPSHHTKLAPAAVVGDIAAMAGPAHALKSSSANLGAMQVSAAAKHIEHGARDRTLANAVDAVSLLSREFRRAELELRTLLH
jgi:HPt (histidine-containing phosphotransfer) domain-containing protein